MSLETGCKGWWNHSICRRSTTAHHSPWREYNSQSNPPSGIEVAGTGARSKTFICLLSSHSLSPLSLSWTLQQLNVGLVSSAIFEGAFGAGRVVPLICRVPNFRGFVPSIKWSRTFWYSTLAPLPLPLPLPLPFPPPFFSHNLHFLAVSPTQYFKRTQLRGCTLSLLHDLFSFEIFRPPCKSHR